MLRRLAILAVLTLLQVHPLQPQAPAQTGGHATNAKAQQNPKAPSSLVVKVDNQVASDKSSEKDPVAPQDPDKWVRRGFWLNAGLTVITLIIAVATLLQANAAKMQAIAAKDSINLSRDTAKRQLRAYFCIDEAALKITPNENGGQPNVGLEGQLHFKNGGQTPAYRVRSWVHGSIGIYPDNIPVPPPPEGLPRGEGIVPAQGKSIIVAQEIKVFPQVMENLRNPTVNAAYYVQGEVRYQDIFKDWHRLKIRLLYGGPTGGRTKKDSNGVTVGFLLPDSWGNCEEDIQCDDEGNPI